MADTTQARARFRAGLVSERILENRLRRDVSQKEAVRHTSSQKLSTDSLHCLALYNHVQRHSDQHGIPIFES